jgi:hypothetical protein
MEWALSVPVAEDTYSTTTNLLSAGTGAATGLAINAKQTAFLRFDLSKPNVVPAAIKPEFLTVHTVSSAWTEAPLPAWRADGGCHQLYPPSVRDDAARARAR